MNTLKLLTIELLTKKEQNEIELKVETFLNKSIYDSLLLSNDSEDIFTTKEEAVINCIIKTLEDKIEQFK